jgi:hypothetical protein
MEGNKKYKEKMPEYKVSGQKNGAKSKLLLIRKARNDADHRILLQNKLDESPFDNKI